MQGHTFSYYPCILMAALGVVVGLLLVSADELPILPPVACGVLGFMLGVVSEAIEIARHRSPE